MLYPLYGEPEGFYPALALSLCSSDWPVYSNKVMKVVFSNEILFVAAFQCIM